MHAPKPGAPRPSPIPPISSSTSMSSNTFSAAIPLLRAHTDVPEPALYRHLCALLTRYTSGLSLPITLDTLPAPVTCAPYHEFTLVKTLSVPRACLLTPAGPKAKLHAFFPHSSAPELPVGAVIRLPRGNGPDDALTLARTLFPEHDVVKAYLHTPAMVIKLPFPGPLPLPHPHVTYTLQNIWNMRDLTPPAVYATLHGVTPDGSGLTLVDTPSSTPVTLTLLPTRRPILSFLKPPCVLLITAPVVTPSETGFTLHDTPGSSFFFSPLPCKKRLREEVPTLHTPRTLSERHTRELTHPLTVHARVQASRACGEGSVINTGDVEIVVPCHTLDVGDEVVLTGVRFRKRWFAEGVCNISTMLGLFYCPFVTRFITIAQASALCKGDAFRTAFVRVCVKAAETARLVRLTVEDCGDGKAGQENGLVRKGCGVVCLKDRGFHQIFGVSKDSFSRLEPVQVGKAVQKIRDAVWLIMVCCGKGEPPVLTACLRAS